MKSVIAWHFLPANLRMTGGRWKNPVRPRVAYLHRGSLKLHENGLHASRRVIDALRYAPGPVISRVSCSGLMVEGDGIFVCERRHVLRMSDIDDLLHAFALWCAERVSDHKILEAKQDWIQGTLETTDFVEKVGEYQLTPESKEKAVVMAALDTTSWVAARETSRLMVELFDDDRVLQNEILEDFARDAK